MRRQPGEEDKVRPEGRIPRPEPNPTTVGQPNTRRLPRPSRFSPKTCKLSYGLTRQPRPETHKPSPTPTHTAQPTYTFPSAWVGSSPANNQKTRERPDNPRLDQRSLQHASPSSCATWHVCSATTLGSGGLIGLAAAYSARETYFRSVCHRSDPPGLSFGPI